MPANIHNFGDLVRVSAEFRTTSNNALVDPTTVKVSIRTPAGTVTTYTYQSGLTIVKLATGQYYADIDATEDGTWFYRWFGTGAAQAAAEGRYEVRSANAV